MYMVPATSLSCFVYLFATRTCPESSAGVVGEYQLNESSKVSIN